LSCRTMERFDLHRARGYTTTAGTHRKTPRKSQNVEMRRER
jgi:hypothetical protein